MAITHDPPADGTFSAAGQAAYDAPHVIDPGTITPTELDRVYTVPADLLPYLLSSAVSSAAYRDSSFFAQSTSIATVGVTGVYTDLSGLPDLGLYQLSSQISSAAFRDSSFFAHSSVISTAAFQLSTAYVASSIGLSLFSGGATSFLSGQTTFLRPDVTQLGGFSGGATTFLSGISTFVRPTVTALLGFSGGSTAYLSGISTFNIPNVTTLTGYGGGSTAYLSGISTFNIPNITTLTGFTGNTDHFLRADSTFAAPTGGSDPWTILQVSASHYGTSNVAFSNIPGLSFSPGTNSTYMVEGMLMFKTSTAAVVPRMRLRWPTGVSAVGWINTGQAQSTQQQWFGNEISTLNNSSTGVSGTTTAAWPFFFGATIRALGGAASSFGVMHSTGSTTVFVSTMIGSYIRYRTF